MDKEKLKTIAKYVLGGVAVVGIGYGTYLCVDDYRRKGQRLGIVEEEVTDLKKWSYDAGAAIDHSQKRIFYLERDTNRLQLRCGAIEKNHDALKTKVDGIEDKFNVFSTKTDTRLDQIEKNLELTGNTVVNIRAEISNKITLIEKNLISINEVLSDVGPTEYHSPEGITSMGYQLGKEVDYLGFSVQKPKKSTVSTIDAAVRKYSEGMQRSMKQFKKDTPDGTIYRTEIVYRNDTRKNMLIVEEKGNSVYVFMKLQNNDEVSAFGDILKKCQLPVADGVKEKMQQLARYGGHCNLR